MAQTSIQNKQTIRTGSAKILIGERFDKLTDIGAGRNISLKESMTTSEIESDNAGVISSLISEHKMEVSLDHLELDFRKYFEMRGGIDNLEEYDGKTEVSREYIVEAGTYKKNELIRVPFKNADGSVVAITKVEKKVSTGNVLIEDTSYTKEDENGIKITGDDIKPTFDSLIITFTQTPAKMVRMTSGGKASTIKPRCILIVNTDANGKELRVYLPQASIAGGLEFSFQPDKAQDVMVNKLTFSATTAGTQKTGEQLAWYEDEQSVHEEEDNTTQVQSEKKETEGTAKENTEEANV